MDEAFEALAAWAVEASPAPVITQTELRDLLASGREVLIVDVRTVEEYAVSRLPGAVSWPDYRTAPPPAELVEHASLGRPVVFYCSIGYRSGEAAVRAARVLPEPSSLLNLRGGIFQWANEGQRLDGGVTVHGFDETWSRWLRPELRAP